MLLLCSLQWPPFTHKYRCTPSKGSVLSVDIPVRVTKLVCLNSARRTSHFEPCRTKGDVRQRDSRGLLVTRLFMLRPIWQGRASTSTDAVDAHSSDDPICLLMYHQMMLNEGQPSYRNLVLLDIERFTHFLLALTFLAGDAALPLGRVGAVASSADRFLPPAFFFPSAPAPLD